MFFLHIFLELREVLIGHGFRKGLAVNGFVQHGISQAVSNTKE